jgi:hypothetical protein
MEYPIDTGADCSESLGIYNSADPRVEIGKHKTPL